jgi:hypothetical protein
METTDEYEQRKRLERLLATIDRQTQALLTLLNRIRERRRRFRS